MGPRPLWVCDCTHRKAFQASFHEVIKWSLFYVEDFQTNRKIKSQLPLYSGEINLSPPEDTM